MTPSWPTQSPHRWLSGAAFYPPDTPIHSPPPPTQTSAGFSERPFKIPELQRCGSLPGKCSLFVESPGYLGCFSQVKIGTLLPLGLV